MSILYMEWVGQLSEVGDPIRRELERLQKLEQEAIELESQGRLKRWQAQRGIEELHKRIGELWTPEEISKAKAQMVRVVTPPA